MGLEAAGLLATGMALMAAIGWAWKQVADRVTMGHRVTQLETLCAKLEQLAHENREIHKAATDAIESMREDLDAGGNVSTEIRDLKDALALLKIRVNAN